MVLQEMAETVGTEVIGPVAKWTLRKIWQELGYMCCYKSNIGDLNKQVQGLRERRDGVKLEVKPAREALQTIDPGVVSWLGDVDKIMDEKDTTFSDDIVAARASCCYGWLPNLKGRFSLGRRAKKMTLKVDQLYAKDLGTISHPGPPPEVEFQPTEDSVQLGANIHEGASSSETSSQEQPTALLNFDSRRSTIKEVMEALRGNQINPIVICGMGGIGKTTLMGQVHEKAKAEALFDEYTKATFKESLDKAADVIHIQGELAEYLGKDLLKDVKERGPRASKLRERLSQGGKKILVMLDNVWTTSPDLLWDIGIPPSCKLLVTSRQQDLFKNMDTRKNFPIHELSDGDAWSLFKKRAGSSIESDPRLHDVAKNVLKECAGLPIAISTVGTALKDESIEIWNNALRELEKANPENIPGVIEDVYDKIKLSYQRLPNKQAKSCLLLCCLFKEGYDIRIEDLVRYGVGLGFFEGIDSITKGRYLVETLVRTLKSRFLLLDCADNDPAWVKMHDVVRDVAVQIASEESTEVRDTAETLKSIDWPMSDQRFGVCRSLVTGGLCVLLQLYLNSGGSVNTPTIINGAEDVKVLDIVGPYDMLSVASTMPSIVVLRNLKTLRLESCSMGPDVSRIGELRELMILSFRRSDIGELPDTFRNLSNLRFLDLTECKFLEVIAPGVMSSLTQLEELYMWDSFKDWETGILAELLSLSRLTTLQIVLPPLNVLETTTVFVKLERFKISIGQPNHSDIWNLRENDNYLTVGDLDESTAVNLLLLNKTTRLEFQRQNVEYLIDPKSIPHGNIAVFPLLRSLDISRAEMLKEIFPGELLPTGSFKKLRSLAITNVDALPYIWKKTNNRSGWSVLRDILGLLQMLVIKNCKSLEEIVAIEFENEEVINFQSLTHLTLHGLPNFTGISKNISKAPERVPEDSSPKQFDVHPNKFLLRDSIPEHFLYNTEVCCFPALRELVIRYMEFKEIWNNQLPAESFCELESLEVNSCDNLLHVVPTHMQNRLHKLKSMKVWLCSSLKEIFEIRRLIVGDEGEAAGLANSESENQGSTQINKMVSCKQSHQTFQNLTTISIYKCESLRTLLSHSIAKGLVKLQTLQIENCREIEEIVVAAAAEGEETKDENMFPQLHTLKLFYLPNLGSFSQGKYNFMWPRVKDVKILQCPNMKKFCLGSLSIPKEVSLEVEEESLLQELIDSRSEI